MRRLASTFATTALLGLGLALGPLPGAAPARADADAEGPMCRAQEYPARAAYDAARVIQALRRARPQPPGAAAPADVVPLNTRGYNYGLPNTPRDLSALGAELRMRGEGAPGAEQGAAPR